MYLATDPDREGEAIAWHLSKILEDDKDKITRVTFNEITKSAVQKAIKEPRNIDMDTVDAQQARRVLDRIVGYKISPLLWKKVKRGLSAGRVQSVAVKLIVDRENEIENFIPQEYWNIYASLKDEKSKKEFEAKFYGKNGKKQEINSKEQVDEILKSIEKAEYTVSEIKKGGDKFSEYEIIIHDFMEDCLFLLNKKAEDKKPATRIVAQEPIEVQPIEETPADKFLSNLASSRALEGSIDLSISLDKPEESEYVTRALDINDLGDIDLSITDLQITISDLTNIKVAGDIEVKTGPLDMKLSLGYFDNTIYLDYLDNHFYLKTSDITDVMQMIPTVGESITLPSEFQNLDFDSLISSLTKGNNKENVLSEDP